MLHVPGLKKNLLSVGQCTSRGYEFKFKGDYVYLLLQDETVPVGVKQSNSIYRMFFEVVKPDKLEINSTSVTGAKVWHERLAHINVRTLKQLASNSSFASHVN